LKQSGVEKKKRSQNDGRQVIVGGAKTEKREKIVGGGVMGTQKKLISECRHTKEAPEG